MKVLVVGSGGREHALVWKLAQSPYVTKLYCAPGNAGTGRQAENIPIAVENIYGLCHFALANSVDLTVVGPELPLSLGIADVFTGAGLLIVGPTQAAAALETSKWFAKVFMQEEGIPTAPAVVFASYEGAAAYLRTREGRIVVKANGLASGKGVVVCEDAESAIAAVHACLIERRFGDAGTLILLEEYLDGEEVSCQCLVDGERVVPLATAQDYKRLWDGKDAPMTGGMGAYSPAPIITPELHARIMEDVVYPTVRGMAARGAPFRGVLYVGLMIVKGEPFVLEFNVRFGDPEAQVILPRIKNDLFPLLAGVARGNLEGLSAQYDDDMAVCVVLATKGYPGTLEQTGLRISGVSRAERYAKTHVFQASTVLDGRGHVVTGTGGRVISVTSLDTTFAEAIARAYRAARRIDWKKKGAPLQRVKVYEDGSPFLREKLVRESGAYRRSDIGHSLLPQSTRDTRFDSLSP